MIVYYDGPVAALVRFETKAALDAWQEDEGMFGGEIEYNTEADTYRAPDWDNAWKHFASARAAAEYYNELAK